MMPNPPKSSLPTTTGQNPQPESSMPSKPVANNNPRRETEAVLGSWRDGHFEFTSPAARETWHRSAYAQGINPQNWHQGSEIDDRTQDVIKAGLGGPTPPYYRGPDGKHRFGNLQTIEPPTLRDIRARHFRGKSIDDLETTFATTGKMPGEDEAVAHLQSPQPLSPRPLSPLPSLRPEPVALSTNAAAILGGMEQVHKTKAEIIATIAQADTGNATDGTADADLKPTPPVTLEPSPKPEKKRATPGHGGGTEPTPKRDYQQLPEPVPASLSIGKATEGKAEWPIIQEDWVILDQRGYPAFTPEASQELDRYRVAMLEEAGKYGHLLGRWSPVAPANSGDLLKHFLDGDGRDISVPANAGLLSGQTISSADEGLQAHVTSWLINPNKSLDPSETIVPKILALKDGESVAVPSRWDGATGAVAGRVGAYTSPSTWSAFGNVQIHGDCVATVTRKGDRYFVTVDIKKKMIDRYDFTDDDGEWLANQLVGVTNATGGKLRQIDLAKLHLLSETGRAKPFNISSAWRTRLTVELRRQPPGRLISSPLKLMPGTLTSTNFFPDGAAPDPE